MHRVDEDNEKITSGQLQWRTTEYSFRRGGDEDRIRTSRILAVCISESIVVRWTLPRFLAIFRE